MTLFDPADLLRQHLPAPRLLPWITNGWHQPIKDRLQRLCLVHPTTFAYGCDGCKRRSVAARHHIEFMLGLYRVHLLASIMVGDMPAVLALSDGYVDLVADLRRGRRG